MGRGRGRNRSVAVIDVGTLRSGREDKSETRIVADLGAFAALDNVIIRKERVTSRSVERERKVEEEAGVGIQQSLDVCRYELSILNEIDVAAVAVEADGIGAARHLA